MHGENAHGYGIATDPKTGFSMTGNFRKNLASGVMIVENQNGRTEVQGFRNGNRFGRGTTYWPNDIKICNYVWTEEGGLVANAKYSKEITHCPEQAFYSKDGKPI